MEEQVIEICKKLRNIDKCCLCGGSYRNGICIYCGRENQEIGYLSFSLEKFINKLPIDVFLNSGLNNILTVLYSIRKMDIPIVDKIMLTTNYPNTVIKNFSSIDFQKVVNGSIDLTNEQYFLLQTLLFSGELNQKFELDITNILIRANLEKNSNYNPAEYDKEKLYLKLAELTTTNIIGLKTVNTNLINDEYEDERKDTVGTVLFNEINLSKKAILNEEKEIFVTIFHECVHLKQYKENNIDRILSYKNLIEIMDSELSDLIPGYYDTNYENISYEKEAHLYQYREAIEYLKQIGVEVPNDFYQKQLYFTNNCQDLMINLDRNYSGIVSTLPEIFEKEIINYPKVIREYPQLQFLYKVEEEQVLPKTLQELENDYQNYKLGILKWNGNSEEICNLYQQRIDLLRIQNKGI